MCADCPLSERYPYYGLPETLESSMLRHEAHVHYESGIRCFIAACDCPDAKRAAALDRESERNFHAGKFLCSNARRMELESALQCNPIEYPNCPNHRK